MSARFPWERAAPIGQWRANRVARRERRVVEARKQDRRANLGAIGKHHGDARLHLCKRSACTGLDWTGRYCTVLYSGTSQNWSRSARSHKTHGMTLPGRLGATSAPALRHTEPDLLPMSVWSVGSQGFRPASISGTNNDYSAIDPWFVPINPMHCVVA